MEEIKKKILRYCAYQERCFSDVRKKLTELGATREEMTQLLEYLTEEGFLNEERFARAYVRGKFRINGWGRLKIKAGLLAKGVEQGIIRTALEEELNPDEYLHRLEDIIRNKGPKTAASRGFEPSLILKSTNHSPENL